MISHAEKRGRCFIRIGKNGIWNSTQRFPVRDQSLSLDILSGGFFSGIIFVHCGLHPDWAGGGRRKIVTPRWTASQKGKMVNSEKAAPFSPFRMVPAKFFPK
jgi:hypothetical protein